MSFSKHTFGSLFAGVGGFDMGFEQAGWDCRFQVEWDKHCQAILNRHWPSVPKWGDVSTVSGHELPAVDCIIFGSPCQDLSVAGKRAGLDGERSGLFHEAMRIIKEMRDATNGTFPRWIVWENVAGAFSSNKGADFGVILDEMAQAGAVAIEWALLDAQHFGVPQRRRRVFVIACFDPATADRCPDPLLPVSESLPGDPQKGRKTRKAATGEVAGCLRSGGSGGVPSSRGEHLVTEDRAGLASGGDIANTISAELYHRSTIVNQDVNNGHLVVGSLAARDYKGVGSQYVDEGKVIVEPFVKSRRPQSSSDDETWVRAKVNPTLNSFDVGDTRTTTAVIAIQGNVIGRQPHNGPAGKGYTNEEDPMFTLTSTDVHAVAYDEYNDRLGGEIHHALRAGTKQSTGVMADMAVRRLTPVECERLMGWPDDHTRWAADGKEQSDTHRYKQCGNGVATPVARWIADHMRRVDEIQ